MAKWALFVLLTAIPAQVHAYLGGALRTHNHSSINQGGTLGDVTASTVTVTNRLIASSGVFTNGWGVANTYGAVFVSSGELVAVSTSNNSGANIFRVYGASGNAIVEFNQNSADDLKQVFRIWNNAGASVLTIQGTGGVTTSAGISQAGNALQTGTGQANFNNSGGNSFKSQLTIVKSSLTIVDSGIYAASGTFTNGVTASSYSLSSASGIKFFDGTTQTTAFNLNRSSVQWNSAATFTNTSAAGCVGTSTTTLTVISATSKGVRCTVDFCASDGTAPNNYYVTVLMDQVTQPESAPAPGAGVRPVSVGASYVNAQPVCVHAVAWFAPMSATAHNFCVSRWTSGGTETTLCDSTNAPTSQPPCKLDCEELP